MKYIKDNESDSSTEEKDNKTGNEIFQMILSTIRGDTFKTNLIVFNLSKL